MATDEPRRYDDDEVEEIFRRAASPAAGAGRTGASREGLTLPELQAIGREVGLPPERVAAAAAELEHQVDAPRPLALLGMPGTVNRTVMLPRLPTEREWELLLADLRTTFAARGRDRSRGTLRDWTNGNLFALVEPTETGARLRLGTMKGDAVVVNMAGIGALIAALVTALEFAVPGGDASSVLLPVVWALVGLAAFGFNALRLSGWADTRERQMNSIAERALALTSAPPGERSEALAPPESESES